MSRYLLGSALLALAAALVVGCAGGDHTTTSSLPVSSSAAPWTETATLVEVDLTWSPAETIPFVDAQPIADALGSHDLHMLFPSQAPVADAGSVSAEFILQRRPSTNEVEEMLLRVDTPDHGVFLFLGSFATATEAAAWEEATSDYEEVEVRGQPGRAYERSETALATVDWQEEGRFFLAQFRGLSLEKVIAWLDSWSTLP